MSECHIEFLCVFRCLVCMYLSKCFVRVNVWTRSNEHEYAFLHGRNTNVRKHEMLYSTNTKFGCLNLTRYLIFVQLLQLRDYFGLVPKPTYNCYTKVT